MGGRGRGSGGGGGVAECADYVWPQASGLPSLVASRQVTGRCQQATGSQPGEAGVNWALGSLECESIQLPVARCTLFGARIQV